jgi:hypothetical protein
VTWAAGLATARETRPVLQSHGGQLFELLVDRGLWAAAGHCLNDPLKQQRFLGDNLGAYDVKPNRAEGAPGSIPMIPMGGMAPSQGDSAPAANDSSVEAASNPGLPMIPMGRNAPAKRDAIPAVPLQGGPPADTQPRESVPMIPMGGPKPAQDTSAGVPAVPMVSMGGPTAARPETPEEVAAEVRSRLTHELRRMSARRYGALLAADRMAEAEAVALALLKYADDDAARAALVTCALRAGCIDRRQSAHLLWLDSVARGAGM